MRLRWHQPIVALGAYLGITLAFLAPVLGRLGSGLITAPTAIQPMDHLQVLWNAWWIERSLFAGANPYFTDMLFVPYGTPLVFHFLTPIQTSAIVLLSSVFSTELSYNLVIIAGFPVAGLGAYALCRVVTRHHWASVVGGVAFMLSPFIVSKAAAGWTNMLYSGVLPLYLACLLHATSDTPARPRLSKVLLALSVVLLLFTGDVTVVFAANVTVCVFAWRWWTSGHLAATVAGFGRALAFSALVAVPYFAMVAYYVFSYGFEIDVGRRLDFIPDLWSYLLPFSPTSIYSESLKGLHLSPTVWTDLGRVGTACYLGIVVLPLALAGFWSGRKDPTVRFVVVLFFLFLALSMGPRLLILREEVRVGPFPFALPFMLWAKIPLLGSVAQSGRYLVISYMAMSVGVAVLTAAVAGREGRTRALLAGALLLLLVCADFAFQMGVRPLPPMPSLAGTGGVVLDPRLRSSQTMYYQTSHERPLAGGYLSRRPEFALRKYRELPGFNCLYFGVRSADCDKDAMLSSLRSLDVTNVLLDPRDWRGEMLARYGFRQHYADVWTVVWEVPR